MMLCEVEKRGTNGATLYITKIMRGERKLKVHDIELKVKKTKRVTKEPGAWFWFKKNYLY